MAQIKAKAILPKKFNAKAFMAELTGEMKAIHKEVDKDFNATVGTWNDKPKFNREFEATDQRIRFFTGTDDAIYGYVSGGTKPHMIRPKRAKVLRFAGTYSAKTTPGTIAAKGGGSSGPEVFARGVKHPGTKARKFDEEIAKKWRRPFSTRMQAAMSRATKKSGHAR